MNLNKQPPTDKPPAQEGSLAEWFMDDFVPRFGKQSLIVLSVVVAVTLGSIYFKGSRADQQAKENKELGRAFVLLEEDNLNGAESMLSGFVKGSHSRLVQDKANLLLGRVYFAKGRYDDAIKAYGQVEAASADQSLISSGALHGLASSYIQKQDYTKAAETLEKFVSKFMRKTGNPSESVAGKEVADLSPAVPNALWKLTLVYRELKNPEKAKATAQKLVKVYPTSRESFDAVRLLAQL